MTFDVLLFKQTGDGYIAYPVLWPESKVYGATEQEALNAVRALIRDLLSRTRFARVEVDVPPGLTRNLWLERAGAFAGDPTWDDFVKSMADYRRQVDAD